MLVALVLTAVIIPVVAISTNTYVRTAAAGELQTSTDSGALAGSAQVPLLNASDLVNYLNATTSGEVSTVVATAQQQLQAVDTTLGLTFQMTNPLTAAVQTCESQADLTTNLGTSFGTTATCSAQYVVGNSLLGSVDSCVTSVLAATQLESTLSGALGILENLPIVGALVSGLLPDINAALSSLEDFLPALASPEIEVSATRTVNPPFSQILHYGSGVQSSTSYAVQAIKNLVVVPDVGTINANYTVSEMVTTLDAALTSIQTALGGDLSQILALLPAALGTALEQVSTNCLTIIPNLETTVNEIVDPPSAGPQLLSTVVGDLQGDPLNVIGVSDSLGIPFLDFVSACINPNGVGGGTTQTITAAQTLVGDVATGTSPSLTGELENCGGTPGGFRSTLERAPTGGA